jgi:hypothetical protein
MIALVCALLSGGMFYSAFGLDDAWMLAWIAPAPILWLAYAESTASVRRSSTKWKVKHGGLDESQGTLGSERGDIGDDPSKNGLIGVNHS